MNSEQVSELVWGHADRRQDAAQGALGHVLARVDMNGDCAAIWMVHHVSAALDPRDSESGALQRLRYLCSRYGRDSTRHTWKLSESWVTSRGSRRDIAGTFSGHGLLGEIRRR